MTVSVTHRPQPAQGERAPSAASHDDPDAPARRPGSVRITRVMTARDRRQFVELPYRLYRDSPTWIPPLRRDEHHRLSAKHNPFHAHASMTLWLAWRDDRLVGRVAAIDDRLHNDTHGERITWFGFFEAEDATAGQALLATVEAHAVAQGHTAVRGPANPSLNDSVGLLVDAFEHDPYVMMPYNPPSYAGFIESAGFTKVKDLLAWDIDISHPLGERIVKVQARFASRQRIQVRPVRMSRQGFQEDLGHLKTIYRAAWTRNWGFVPPTDAEIDQLAVELKPVVDPELALFAEVNGQVAGCALALPDLNQVLRHMGGRLWPFGVFHFLRRRSLITRVRVLLLGVLPAYQHLGVYPLLIADLHRRSQARGYTRAELSWTLEDNHLVNEGIVAAGGRHHKTYRVYEKSIG